MDTSGAVTLYSADPYGNTYCVDFPSGQTQQTVSIEPNQNYYGDIEGGPAGDKMVDVQLISDPEANPSAPPVNPTGLPGRGPSRGIRIRVSYLYRHTPDELSMDEMDNLVVNLTQATVPNLVAQLNTATSEFDYEYLRYLEQSAETPDDKANLITQAMDTTIEWDYHAGRFMIECKVLDLKAIGLGHPPRWHTITAAVGQPVTDSGWVVDRVVRCDQRGQGVCLGVLLKNGAGQFTGRMLRGLKLPPPEFDRPVR